LLCAVQDECPSASDSKNTEAAFKTTLVIEGLSLNSELKLLTKDLPTIPDVQAMARCKSAASPETFASCVLPGDIQKQLSLCVAPGASPIESARCILTAANDSRAQQILSCLDPGTPSGVDLRKCPQGDVIYRQSSAVQECLSRATESNQRIDCVTSSLNIDAKNVSQCLIEGQSTSPMSAVACLGNSYLVAKYARAMDCLSNSGNDPINCTASLLGANDAPLAQCLISAADPSARITCVASANSDIRLANQIIACVNGDAASLLSCLQPQLNEKAAPFANCVSAQGNSLSTCMSQVGKPLMIAAKVISCVQNAEGATASLSCAASELGGDLPKVMSCLDRADNSDVAACLFSSRPEFASAQKLYQCATAESTAASLLANCTNGVLNDQESRALSCIAQSDGESYSLIACGGGLVLTPDEARLVQCAAESDGLTSFAICEAAPMVNAEWRIAAECVVTTGGYVIATAACIGTRLTIRELVKCFSGNFGKDCYGPNNTLVKGFNNAFHDITHGPGESNEIVKAARGIGGAMQQAVSQLGSGVANSLSGSPPALEVGTINGQRVCVPWC
jgi:hypothetical protein